MSRSNIAFGNWIERNKVRRGVFGQIFMTLLAISLHQSKHLLLFDDLFLDVSGHDTIPFLFL